MKRIKVKFPLWITLVVGIGIGCWAMDAWAAEPLFDQMGRWYDFLKTNLTRPMWDTVMRWVNFIILAALILKYARTPVVNFLKEKKAETTLSIQLLEGKKREAEAKIKDSQRQLATSQEKLALIKERILSEGERRKEQIISQAHQESQRMLEGAKLKIDSQIREAYNAVRLELIDMAVENAVTKLPHAITDEDQQNWIGLWMDTARKSN